MEKQDKQNDKSRLKNLHKRGDSWVFDFRFRGERYVKVLGAMSPTLANERAEEKRTAVRKGKIVVNGKRWNGDEWIIEIEPAKAEDPVFKNAMERYLEFYETENAEYTFRKYAKPAAKNLTAFFGEYRLSQISLVLIEKFKRDRKVACECPDGPRENEENPARCAECKRLGRSRSDATVNRELTLLRHFFNKCIDFQLAASNPFRVTTKLADGTVRVQKVNLFEEHGRERYLNQEESQRLLNACKPELRVVVLAAMHTGFRSSELKALRWKNLDLVKGFATVESRYSKNGETRTVPLSDDLRAALQDIHDDRKPSADDSVLTHDGGKSWTCWKEAFNGAVARAGIKDFRFHDLRHCFGSHLGMNDTNQKAMMELMGHKDPKMTLRYTHLSVEYKRQAVQKLPRLTVSGTESQQISQQPEEKKVVSFSK